jgi:hypothetical protein
MGGLGLMGNAGLIGNFELIESAGLPMKVLVSWEMQGSFMGMQGSWETWASPEGGGLPMMVLVSWEMQGSVMGDAGPIGNVGLTRRCWSPHDGISLMGDAGLIIWRCRAHLKVGPH